MTPHRAKSGHMRCLRLPSSTYRETRLRPNFDLPMTYGPIERILSWN